MSAQGQINWSNPISASEKLSEIRLYFEDSRDRINRMKKGLSLASFLLNENEFNDFLRRISNHLDELVEYIESLDVSVSNIDFSEETRRLEKWKEFVRNAKRCYIALRVHYGKNQFEESVEKLEMIPGHLNQILRNILSHQTG